MSLYRDSYKCAVDAILGDMIDGTGSMKKVEESKSEGQPPDYTQSNIMNHPYMQ